MDQKRRARMNLARLYAERGKRRRTKKSQPRYQPVFDLQDAVIVGVRTLSKKESEAWQRKLTTRS